MSIDPKMDVGADAQTFDTSSGNGQGTKGPEGVRSHAQRLTTQSLNGGHTEETAGRNRIAAASRFGAAGPLAVAVTVCLTLSMSALIAVEFQPQSKSEPLYLDINPMAEALPPLDDIPEPDPLREVEIPPAPPTVATDQVAEVKLPFREVRGKPTIFDPTDMDMFFKDQVLVRIDGDPTPTVRIPPVFPARFSRGNHSGYCKVRFDVSAEGRPYNVAATECSSGQLKSPTIKSVQKWKYNPKIANGRPVSMSGLETTVKFDLRDERGEILPLP